MKELWHKIKRFFKWVFMADHQFFFGRIPISLKGNKWELHITDMDPKPSVPHLHCVTNKNKKINIYNGEVYDDGINIGKLKQKEFNALWHNTKFLNMVNKAIIFYKQNNPNYKLVRIPFDANDIDNNVIISPGKNKDELVVEYQC